MRCFYELLCVTEELVSTFESIFFSYAIVAFVFFFCRRQFFVSSVLFFLVVFLALLLLLLFFNICISYATDTKLFELPCNAEEVKNWNVCILNDSNRRMNWRHTVLCVCCNCASAVSPLKFKSVSKVLRIIFYLLFFFLLFFLLVPTHLFQLDAGTFEMRFILINRLNWNSNHLGE